MRPSGDEPAGPLNDNGRRSDHSRASGSRRKYGRTERGHGRMDGEDADAAGRLRHGPFLRGRMPSGPQARADAAQPDDSGAARFCEAGCRAGRKPERSNVTVCTVGSTSH